VLFRGGILKLCQRLFKDRVLAKKYEDYTTLRLLIAVTLASVYLFLITFVLVILPSLIWSFVVDALDYLFSTVITNLGEWVLFIGLVMFVIVILVYIGFVIWNHGVFTVLKRVKRIEEEYEVDEQIKRDELKGAEQMGKKAIYRGKETKAFKAWKKSMLT